jgi:hypothetical protein
MEVIAARLGTACPDIIAIDTVARALTELDENSAKDTGLFIAAGDRLKRLYDCALLEVHHTGKDQKWARGSYRLMTDAEIRIRVQSDKVKRRLKLVQEKNKDAAVWAEPVVMDGRVVALPDRSDEDGKPITSLAFKRVMPTAAAGAEATDPYVAGSTLRQEVAAAIRGHPTTTVQLEHVAESIAHARTRKGGAAEGHMPSHVAQGVLAELRQGCRPKAGRRNGPKSPPLLARFLTKEYEPKGITFLRLPASNVSEVPEADAGEDKA